MNVLVSACLMGFGCRYDGGVRRLSCLDALGEHHVLIPVCPEVMGGLPTPRPPSEIRDGRVITRDGRDVTQAFLRGAQEAARLAQACGCGCALLKERSPSCGLGQVYDGTFTGTLTDGDGLCARLLVGRGLRVIGESQVEELLASREEKSI